MAGVFEKDYKSHQYRVKQLKASIDMIVQDLIDEYNDHLATNSISNCEIPEDALKGLSPVPTKDDIMRIAIASSKTAVEAKVATLLKIKGEVDELDKDFIKPILKEFEKAKRNMN